ncbi:TolC family protein [Halodesulfovibrio marinisediminis]|uniref:Outer membrane protein TolC n=1 Tax=Halodesulfovibrio marinisediminis DSM 17456 TaxID=1121457 RepID=A0A1N6IG59_9BACT|nr:TolC family protein [Halodesulfovibrio marinisediminis]SIO30949.1 Outer membrane protein TolC [Halodesulfovibrio marinisediminis DSM 17456]
MTLSRVTECYCEIISLDTLEKQAIEHSPDLDKYTTETKLQQERLEEQQYDFYPTLRAQGNTEYSSDLSNGWGSVVSVGDVVQSTGTKYQNSMSVRANYVLYDFGIRFQKELALKKAILASKSTALAEKLKLRLNVLQTYSAAMALSQQVRNLQKIVQYSEELKLICDRLFTAGKKGPIDAARQYAELKRKENELSLCEFEFNKKLEELNFYTGSSLQGNVQFSKLPRPDLTDFLFDIDKHPGVERYSNELSSQQAETAASEGEYFPKVSLYGSYLLYGSNSKDMVKAYEDVSESNFKVGVSLVIPLSDALRNRHKVQQSELAEQRIRAEKRKLKEQLQTELNISQRQYKYLINDQKQKREMVNILEKELNMLNRLKKAKEIDAETAIRRSIVLLEQKTALDKSVIELSHELLRLQYQMEATKHE